MDERVRRIRVLCDRAVFGGETDELASAEGGLDAAEAELTMARARLLHTRFLSGGEPDPREPQLLERAAELFRSLGDARGEAEAACWTGIYRQVVLSDGDGAEPILQHAAELATAAGDKAVLAYALCHLGVIAHAAGRLERARNLLEESTMLRRQLGMSAGVAVNLVGLIYIAAAEGRREDAVRLLAEARLVAAASGARAILDQIDDAAIKLSGYDLAGSASHS
jgi:tetratricopeptide (TPR) repeat protein